VIAPLAVPLVGLPCVGCRSRGSGSIPSSLWRRASSSSSGACLHKLVEPCSQLGVGGMMRGAGSSSELIDAEATQTLHSRVGMRCRVVCAL
jgi:hypothetical protein